ncbi:MAG: YbjN domain-containing protein [Proteobacteria bacterium]|nr:YbjN domain-containing protein [Pseudomonadota bacterium]
MATLFSDDADPALVNPLENIEHVLGVNGWPYERMSDEEISATVKGKWCEYFLRFYWQEEGQILQLACILDLTVPEDRKQQVYETLSILNERLWLGHFEIWDEDNVIMFRHASLAEDGANGISSSNSSMLMEIALTECERFYPVFQFVAWNDNSSAEALDAAMLNTVGEA